MRNEDVSAMSKNLAIAPRLRFPDFRETEGWTTKRLKDTCEVNPANPGIPEVFAYIDLESVEAGELKNRKVLSRNEAPSRAQRLLRYGDVIFQIVRPYQRNNLHFKIDDGIQYVASTGYAQLRANESEDFLFQSIQTDDFVDRVIVKCTGSSYPAINSSDLAEIPVPIPSSAEQQKIADCLSSIDELISAEALKLDALKVHKKGLMQRLFPAEGETIPRLRFPEFRDAGEWKKKKISDVLMEAVRPLEMEDDEEYSLVLVKRRYEGIVSRGKLQGKSIKVKSQFFLQKDDFLISKRQIVHCACGLVPDEFDGAIVSNEYSVLRAKNGFCIKFFKYFCQQPVVGRSFLECSIGIVIEKMLFKLNDWLKREFLFPSLDEQVRIANHFSSIEELIAAQDQMVNALKTHKHGLMQQLFPVMDEMQT
ncbi:restriction endonuclease subunit S [Comamonas denitrificans]|nr:restriction endonuclease subunit S [Comamonas denitrificans]